MSDDQALKQVVRAMLGVKPSIARRRAVVAQLRQLADEQERVADAQQQQAARPAAARVGPRKATAGPGRAPSNFVRIERSVDSKGTPRLVLYIGRDLVYQLGLDHGARLDVQRDADDRLCLVVVRGDLGFALQVQTGRMPRIVCARAAERVRERGGRYAAATDAGRRLIVIGGRLDA